MRAARAGLVALAVLAGTAYADRDGDLGNAAAEQAMAERALAVGEFERGMPFAEGALRDREAALGPDDPLVADSAVVLGVMRGKNGDRKGAELLLTRALRIREKTRAKDSPEVAAALVALGEVLRDAGDYAKAEPMLVRALAIHDTRGESPATADALEALALLWAEKDDPRCEAMLARAIAILEKASGADSVAVARPVKELADLLARRGDPTRAEPLYRRAMAILESTEDLGHPQRATALLDFARVRLANGDPAQAIALGDLAYTVDTAILGARHPRVARDLMQLAALARAGGDAARAERYTWRAVSIREQVLGAEHPEVGAALAELATSYAARGDIANASKLLSRALAIFRRGLGAKHPAVATALVGLAKLSLATKDVPAAITAMTEAGEVREASLELLLAAGSERQKRLYLSTLADETDAAISLHAQLAPTSPAAARLALLTILRRKGRVLDTMADTVAALRGRVAPADVALLDRLAAARARLAALVLQGPIGGALDAHDAEVRDLEAEAQRLESEVSAKSAAFRVGRARVTLEAVQAAIPEDRALVEIASYRPLALPGAPAAARRYIAYVLTRRGEPRWVDLGPEAAIDAQVKVVRVAFANADADATAPARGLDALAMAPVRALLGATRAIFVSPDGALNLVPFAAFVDERGRYLIQDYAITYLTTGRDLLRMAAPPAATSNRALVIANPAFGADAAVAAAPGQRRSLDLSDVTFPPLPATAEEGVALGKRFGAGSLITGAEATEAALKRARAPIVLHIATHGFFLTDVAEANANTRGLVRVSVADGTPAPPVTAATTENPLLRSGLALAGANQRKSGDDDGVLTALEASGLDLYGTQLVVLSACETGLGEVKNGEGVYGLRRALVIAGSESQVISLWEVNDRATRDLMIGYYDKLGAGAGRSEALRAAQLAMLASADRRHPFYWASFIPSGDWRPVRGSLSATPVGAVGRSAHGCGCATTGSSAESLAGLAVVLALVLRRRRGSAVRVLVLVAIVRVASPAQADPYKLILPASKLELELAGSPTEWMVTDASRGGHAWDSFHHSAGPELTVALQTTSGPTSCLLAMNLRYLDGFKGVRAVTAPSYLPAEMYPEALEASDPTSATVMACADLPDGTVTAVIRYTGAAWASDAMLVRPLLRAYATAAAWGLGARATVDRTIVLPATGLTITVPPGWREHGSATIDVVTRLQPGKPTLVIGLLTDVGAPPVRFVNGKLVQSPRVKGPLDDCAGWEDQQKLQAKPDVELVPRPAFAPPGWYPRASVVMEPRHDQLTLCLDTPVGRWLAVIQYFGAWTDPGVAEAAAVLKTIKSKP